MVLLRVALYGSHQQVDSCIFLVSILDAGFEVKRDREGSGDGLSNEMSRLN